MNIWQEKETDGLNSDANDSFIPANVGTSCFLYVCFINEARYQNMPRLEQERTLRHIMLCVY